MTRNLRFESAGAIHHVYARGNNQQDVFLDDEDRHWFLWRLRKIIDRLGWECLAWCLMSNHHHLAIRTPEPNLAEGLRDLHGRYAYKFNERHGGGGHVWQGRYGSRLVLSERYVQHVVRYIVCNPVAVNVVGHPSDYAWSSHRGMLGIAPLAVTNRTAALEFFGGSTDVYRDYVEAGGDDLATAMGPVAGPPDSVEALLRDVPGWSPPRIRRLSAERPPLASLLGEEAGLLEAVDVYGYTHRQVAAVLGCHHTTVGRRVRRARGAPQRE